MNQEKIMMKAIKVYGSEIGVKERDGYIKGYQDCLEFVHPECFEIVSDEELNNVFENTNFGPMPRRSLLKFGLLKCAGGYYTGHTMKCILSSLGLTTKKWTVSKKGQKYLFAAFSHGYSI